MRHRKGQIDCQILTDKSGSSWGSKIIDAASAIVYALHESLYATI